MKCLWCQHENPAQAKFCLECGTPLERPSEGAPPGASYAELQRALSEALEQQIATSEILRIISSSPTRLQQALHAIAERAARLCDAWNGTIVLSDGEALRMEAHYGPLAEQIGMKLPIDRASVSGRAFVEGRSVHVDDLSEAADFTLGRQIAVRFGVRTILAVPLVREAVPIGVILIRRTEVRPFSDKQITLLQTFADQAVIAIENVRLFTELEARNRDLTATSEILQVISRSPTDVQPVFDTIAERAMRLCDAAFGAVLMFDGALIHLSALANVNPEGVDALRQAFPMAPSRGTTAGRVILTGDIVQIPDVLSDPEYQLTGPAQAAKYRCILGVPMLHQGRAIGAIHVTRPEPGAFSEEQIQLLKTFADQAVIAIENVRLFKELQARNRELMQALDRETAAGEILRTINSSPTSLEPIFDAILANGLRLCEADVGLLFLVEGDVFRLVAERGAPAEFVEPRRAGTRSGPHTGLTRAARERRPVQIEDMMADRAYTERDPNRLQTVELLGARTGVWVPMLREGAPVGVLVTWRREVRPFTDAQIDVLTTFADQAVIAIENVRLFNELGTRNRELTESLEQQTATSEILRVISSSPTELQPVLDALVKSAVRFCGADDATIQRLEGDGLPVVAHHGPIAAPIGFVTPAGRGTTAGRSLLERRAVHVANYQAETEEFPEGSAIARELGFNAILTVPLLREGMPLGVILLRRIEGEPFSGKQIALLQTFADQAVIAIENVRLFTELQEKNRALTAAHAQVTEALERQTATSEILRVISSSPTDVQPVFDIIGERAERLCAAEVSLVTRFDGELIQLVALHGVAQEGVESVRQAFPMRCDAETVTARAFRNCAVIHIPDVLADPLYQRKDEARAGGYRGGLGVPMVREGRVVGVIFVARRTPGYFTDSQVELLKTFADQAVIAVENVRLFQELEARTRDLTRSVNELQALSDVGRALSSTLDLETVLRTIVSRANQLAGTDSCSVYEYDDQAEQLLLRATDKLDEAVVAVAQRAPIRRGEGVAGRMAVTREPVQIADIAEPGAYHGPLRDILLRTGTRALLGVPLLREEQLIGGLTVTKKTPGEFSSEVIDLLKTFAAQSALAIQNARLFREIADKSRQLEDASRHKSEFLANMSHELRTPLNAIIGFSEVLNERMFGELNEKQAEYLKDIYASGQHLLSLINDILDLSKIEAGRMELEATDFDLPSAIDNALILVRERATRRGITLGRTLDEQLGMLRGDERKVKQVLLNLLSNALKFTPEGGRIDVSAGVHDGVAEIAVTDTGVGIAPEDQEAVFEEFRQVGTADKKVEGTGLGLALSRKFIELHGGRIWVESEVGKGSTFRFTLPSK